MKIKTFTASSSMEALNLAREALGGDAIIISTETLEDGRLRMTAAVEEAEEINFDEAQELVVTETNPRYSDRLLRESLEYHSVLDLVKERILSRVRRISAEQQIYDDRRLLEICFAQMFSYQDILDLQNPLKLFMGSPGSGKSTAIAKMAAQAKLKNISCCIISTDNVRAGANRQLEAFAEILGQDFYFCKSDRNLYELLQKARSAYQLQLVDTPGINPFLSEEVKKVSALADAAGGMGILTLSAGTNTCEAIEIAEVFTEIGAKQLLPTRLDLTRRIGSLLSVASCCELSLGAASVSASIAAGLSPIDNKSLSGLVMG